VLNKLSDAASRDLKRAGRAFQAADRDAQGSLDFNGLNKYVLCRADKPLGCSRIP